jgi:predicted nucleic acid-binding protein
VSRLVVDASVAIKWVIGEEGSADAARLLANDLLAPELLVAECTNILWKKVRRGELTLPEAMVAAEVLASVDIELVPMMQLMDAALSLSVSLPHPAYDCFYVALAQREGSVFVTADASLCRKVAGHEAARQVVELGAWQPAVH